MPPQISTVVPVIYEFLSDTMKAAVGGIGSAIGSRSSTPAGYNVPGYNPIFMTKIS